MATISHDTGRWELVNPNRRILGYRHPECLDPTGRWHYVNVDDQTGDPFRDQDSMELVDDIVDSLIICRSGSTEDAGAQLSIIASLAEELDARLPETIFYARHQQGYTWAEIARRLDTAESTIRHRYSHYLACRKEMTPLEPLH
jgi:DNA-directed RNA polymerase specialized sigma24 family protein